MDRDVPLARRLRESLREAGVVVAAFAWSGDGVTFGFQSPIAGAPTPGTWLRIDVGDRDYLGYVTDASLEEMQALEVEAAGIAEMAGWSQPTVRARVMSHRVRGSGTLAARLEADGAFALTDATDTFDEAAIALADGRTIERYLSGLHAGRPLLAIGTTGSADRGPALVDPRGFNRHTFLCGQSGYGKSYAMGVLLERLLAETSLRLVVLDPNGDFVRLGQLARPDDRSEEARRLVAAARELHVFGASTDRSDPLRVRLDDLEPSDRAALALLDPIVDREEYALFVDLVARARPDSRLEDLAGAAESGSAVFASLATRMRNLGVMQWGVWARGQASATATLDDGPGHVVADLSVLGGDPERWVAAQALLTHLWRRREERRPTLIVVDEAHNLCPPRAEGPLQRRVAERIVQIAAEGRKYGLYLLLATQRPTRIHPSALTQAQNLVLMKTESAADRQDLATFFSHIPPALIERAVAFRTGEALVGGPLADVPMIMRFGGRRSAEPGADVPPSTWTSRAAGLSAPPA